MTLRHFRIFITVVECKRVCRAAEQLFISQPAVSQAISELENHYQVKLFERLSQRLYLTSMGELLLPYARQAVELFDHTEKMMIAKREVSCLSIGASVSIGTTLLFDILKQYKQKYGELSVNVVVNNTPTIEEMVCSGKLDLGIVEGRVDHKSLCLTPVCEDELVVIAGVNHPFCKKKEILLEDLNGQVLISREEGSVSRNQLEQLLIEQGIQMEKSWSCSNSQAIKRAVMEGYGIAIISRLLIQQELDNHELNVLNIKGIDVRRTLHAIYHKDKYVSSSMKNFLSTIDGITNPHLTDNC